jgi:hypothetical protein
MVSLYYRSISASMYEHTIEKSSRGIEGEKAAETVSPEMERSEPPKEEYEPIW